MTFYKPSLSVEKDTYDDSTLISQKETILNDGRPVVSQLWAEIGYTFITYFFSQEGIEHLESHEIIPYLVASGISIDEPSRFRPSIDKWSDDQQKACWRVTLTVGKPDE